MTREQLAHNLTLGLSPPTRAFAEACALSAAAAEAKLALAEQRRLVTSYQSASGVTCWHLPRNSAPRESAEALLDALAVDPVPRGGREITARALRAISARFAAAATTYLTATDPDRYLSGVLDDAERDLRALREEGEK